MTLRIRGIVLPIFATVALLVTTAGAAAAQLSLSPTTPRLADIARIAQEGSGDSARVLVARILATTSPIEATYPEILYTAGAVARTGDSMRTVFSRLTVEFSNSPWAAKSLLRLVELDFGLNRMDVAVTNATRIFTEFSDSPVVPTAALWGARAAFAQQKAQLACDWLTRGVARVGDDLELKNQLLFKQQSCNLGPGVQFAPMNPDSLRAGPPPRVPAETLVNSPPPPPPAAPPAKGGATRPPLKGMPAAVSSPWRVQVAAVRDKAVIQQLSRKIEAAGFKVYTVPVSGGLVRVQAGPFATRNAALAGVARIRAATGGSPIVVAAQ